MYIRQWKKNKQNFQISEMPLSSWGNTITNCIQINLRNEGSSISKKGQFITEIVWFGFPCMIKTLIFVVQI